jgi:hypothetical protein
MYTRSKKTYILLITYRLILYNANNDMVEGNPYVIILRNVVACLEEPLAL